MLHILVLIFFILFPALGRHHPLYVALRLQQGAVVLVSSRLGLVVPLPRAPRELRFTRAQYPFFRRYGVNLPSSLTRDHSSTCVSSTCLPVSVCGTGTRRLPSGHFSAAQAQSRWRVPKNRLPIASQSSPEGICLPRLPTSLDGARLAAQPATQHPTSVKRRRVVQEYAPVVHRLRLSPVP